MSLRGSKGISSLSRRARRMIGGLKHKSRTRIRVPLALVTASVVLFTVFIVGGGIYDLLDNPLAIVAGPQGWISIHPLLSEQTLNESILSMILNILIFTGLFTSYRSTQIVYDSKRATTMLVLGIALILLGLSGSYYLVRIKLSS